MEPPTTRVTTRIVTEDPPPLTVSFRFPVALARVPVGLAAAPAPLPPPAVAAAPALVAPDTADVEVAEPQVPERPHFPTEDVRFTNDDILHTDELPNFFPADSIPSDTDTTCENSVYISNFPTVYNSEVHRLNLLVQIYLLLMISDPRLPPRDYH